MLHLEFLTRSIRPNGHTPVQYRSLQAKKTLRSPLLQLINISSSWLVTIDTDSISGLAARDYMYHDERIQGGIFTPVLVVTDRSVFVEVKVMNRSILFEHATCMIYLLSI